MPSACFIHEEQQRVTETAGDGALKLHFGVAAFLPVGFRFATEAGLAHSLDRGVVLFRASECWLGFCFLFPKVSAVLSNHCSGAG